LNFGQNLLDWFISQAQPIAVICFIAVGIFFLAKREISNLLGGLLLAAGSVFIIFSPQLIINSIIELGQKILGG